MLNVAKSFRKYRYKRNFNFGEFDVKNAFQVEKVHFVLKYLKLWKKVVK